MMQKYSTANSEYMLRLSASGLRHICFRKAPANVMYPQPVAISALKNRGGRKPLVKSG
jgi:hypothetical protein